MTALSPPVPEAILKQYEKALQRRTFWQSHWQDCYDYALPQHGRRGQSSGDRRHDHVYDGTAADAVDQLAASMLANLTPPWSQWIGIVPGPDLTMSERDKTLPLFEKMASVLQMHMDRSNFTIEVHQAFLDLVTAGTACLLFEESGPGERSAFRFTAIPLDDVVLEEGPEGRLDITYRRAKFSTAYIEKITASRQDRFCLKRMIFSMCWKPSSRIPQDIAASPWCCLIQAILSYCAMFIFNILPTLIFVGQKWRAKPMAAHLL